MNLQRWIARKEPHWKALSSLLAKVDKQGLKALSATELKSMSGLYRSVSADLARAQTHQVGQTLIHSLQSLTSRAYSQIYQGSTRQEWQALKTFILWGFPSVVQKTWIYSAIAMALVGVSGAIAWWLSWRDPSFMTLVVPSSMIEQVREGELWMGSIVGSEPLASSGIMVNNLVVCFRAVAGGITAGLFTVYVLVFNGILLGTVAALVAQNQLAYPFWAFVLPHGSLELPAIFFAGGAGLLIGRALLFPGLYRRIDALKVYGTQAVQLVYGIVPMLVIAGTIEGFFSPSPIVPDALKYAVGTLILVAFVSYCSRRTPQALP